MLFRSDCVTLLDGDGTQRHWKYEGSYVEQPWLDTEIYQVIKSKWNQLRNEEVARKTKQMNKGRGKPARRYRR